MSGQLDYERSDARPGVVFLFAIGLSVLIAVVLVAMGSLFRVLEEHAGGADVAPHALRLESTPPGPRLQAFPSEDLERHRRRQDRLTGTYGWIDVQSGVVRIPIERALELTAERGLPARAERPGEQR